MSRPCTVSVVIKALNEERRIEAAVQSALAAVAEVGGEVILADSCSTDRTVEIASRYPITIVQLANPAERCCGAGPQMGYQHAKGEFIYILDGDMKMLPGFLPAAVAYMRQHPNVVGVGGMVVEMNKESLEYIARMERASGHMQPGEVDRLDMGGLYRKAAVDATGYFSDRNLHSYEEFDLAVRLRVRGGRLWRLNVESVQHHGHDAPPYALLRRRWQSKYICGLGELLRASWGQPQLRLMLTGVRELKLYIAVLMWWAALSGIALLITPLSVKAFSMVIVLVMPLIGMAWRKRSIRKAVFSVVSWSYNTAGLIRGALTPQVDARAPLGTVMLRKAASTAETKDSMNCQSGHKNRPEQAL